MYGVNYSFDILRLLESEPEIFYGRVHGLKPTSVDQEILADASARTTLLEPNLKSRFQDAVGGVFADVFYHPEKYEAKVSREWNPDKSGMTLTYTFSEAGAAKVRQTCLKAVHYLCNGEDMYLEELRAYTEQLSDMLTEQRAQNIEDVFAQAWVSEEDVETRLLNEAIENANAESTCRFNL